MRRILGIFCIILLLSLALEVTNEGISKSKVNIVGGNPAVSLEQNESESVGENSTVSLVILVHDVSPVYFDYLREIVRIIDSFGLQDSTYLLVIPDHAGKYDLTEYPRFVEYLHSLERDGYHIGLHGYTHIGREFDCNGSAAEDKLKKALGIMRKVNLTPTVFLPPRYALSKEALKVVLSHNLSVITKNFIVFPNGTTKRITNREYTWYLSRVKLPFELKKAEGDYLSSEYPFYLSIHPKAANNEAGMKFLREFLEFVVETWRKSPVG